jgi:hypothetical protein
MFRALVAHPQEGLHKRHLVYCVRVMSVGRSNPGADRPWIGSRAGLNGCRKYRGTSSTQEVTILTELSQPTLFYWKVCDF